MWRGGEVSTATSTIREFDQESKQLLRHTVILLSANPCCSAPIASLRLVVMI